ncbi:MAG: hypothetical protein WCI02_14690 [Planctomycetota bacterium]|jgi:hypothetical protein
MKTLKIAISILAAVAFALIDSRSSEAKQTVANLHGRQVVVHTNPVPVFLHRLVPPNHGRHVTLREYQSGGIPGRSR